MKPTYARTAEFIAKTIPAMRAYELTPDQLAEAIRAYLGAQGVEGSERAEITVQEPIRRDSYCNPAMPEDSGVTAYIEDATE